MFRKKDVEQKGHRPRDREERDTEMGAPSPFRCDVLPAAAADWGDMLLDGCLVPGPLRGAETFLRVFVSPSEPNRFLIEFSNRILVAFPTYSRKHCSVESFIASLCGLLFFCGPITFSHFSFVILFSNRVHFLCMMHYDG